MFLLFFSSFFFLDIIKSPRERERGREGAIVGWLFCQDLKFRKYASRDTLFSILIILYLLLLHQSIKRLFNFLGWIQFKQLVQLNVDILLQASCLSCQVAIEKDFSYT
jgi:hypothetical protein